MTVVSASRSAAYDLLYAVLHNRQTLDAALQAEGFDRLTGSDRSFAHALAGTVLRHMGSIDAIIKRYVPKTPPPPAHLILRLGIAQMVYLDTPAHAAVNTAVDLAKSGPARGQSGLINAVLRRVMTDLNTLKAVDEAEVPHWLLSRWQRSYGQDQAQAIARTPRTEPPLDITARDPAARSALLAAGGIALPIGSIRLPAGTAVHDLPGFDTGGFWVQGAAASLPAQLLVAQPGQRVLDLCAAPGGKTLQLAAQGANVTAVDDNPQRVVRLRENLARTGLSATAIVADATKWAADAPFDAVLLDAPCLATGILRRKPDSVWLKQATDLTGLCRLQAHLIDNALRNLKPGGTLVYSVCSLEHEEAEEQVKAALFRHSDITPSAITPSEVPTLEHAITPQGTTRILPTHWPDLGGIEGFFIARFVKRAL